MTPLNPFEVVSIEDAEKADAVICAPADTPTPWPDNVRTTCHDCDTPIIHRPYIPAQPMKLCFACGMQRMQGGRA
jgi:hypothetical protein